MSPAALAMRIAGPPARCFPGVARMLARTAGDVAWRVRPSARRRVIRNLLPACDGGRAQARRASRAVFRNVAAYYVELLTMPAVDASNLEAAKLEVIHAEHLAVLDEGRPVILLSAHMGNPEVAVQGLIGRDRPFVAIVEPLADRDFATELLRLRNAPGGTFVEASPGGLLQALRTLRAGGVVAMLGDRDIQGNGVCATLLGRQALLPRGPWELARRTGAIILPGFCARQPDGRIRVTFEASFAVEETPGAGHDIVEAAGHWARLFERHLRQDPGQWAVIEDYWTNHACDGHPGDRD